jgi:DNA-directed RNA polymerase subunit RPC12/RpoP
VKLKTTLHFGVRTRIRCPKCGEAFDKVSGNDTTLRCTRCGSQLNISREATGDGVSEPAAEVAAGLAGMGGMLPKYASTANPNSLTRPLNIIGAVAAAWAISFPFPYAVVISVCAVIPAVAIVLMAYLKGRIDFETGKRKSDIPDLTFSIAAPPAALAFRALYDFRIFTFDAVWLPVSLVSVLFTLLIFTLSADVKRKPLHLLVTLLFGFMYAYGVVVEANCMNDRSRPRIYVAKVLDKRISYSSKSHSYYIRVGPWGPRTADGEISIRKSEFERIRVNDEITIGLKEGSLNIPWFFIQLKH